MVNRHDSITIELESLRESYFSLIISAESALETTKPSPQQLKRFSQQYLFDQVEEPTVEGLFNSLTRCSDFLNYSVLELIISFFLKKAQSVVRDLKDYIQNLTRFKESTALRDLMEGIVNAHTSLATKEGTGEFTVIVCLVGGWYPSLKEDFEKLVTDIFWDKESILAHMKIIDGASFVDCDSLISAKEPRPQPEIVSATFATASSQPQHPGDRNLVERHAQQQESVDKSVSLISDIEELRRLTTAIVHPRFTPVQEHVSKSAMLLQFILRLKFEVRGWCSLEDCVEVADNCGISREDLLAENGILQYLHNSFGTILHFRGLMIGQRVIINTNIIMAPINELHVYVFGTKKAADPETVHKIRTTGEIPQYLMDNVCSSENVKQSDDQIPTNEIVELLASRYILYENVRSANEETTYFLPSLLFPDHNVIKESSDPTLLSALFYSPLLLLPSTGLAPHDLFPAIVVNLCQKKSWTLDDHNRFRNRIQFYIQCKKVTMLHMELRTLSTHLEFRILPAAEPVNPHLMPVVRQELWDTILEVSSLYSNTKGVKWQCGFYCPYSLVPGGHPHPALCQTMEEPQDMICSLPDCHQGPIALEDRCWFTEVQINTDSGRDSKLNEPAPKKGISNQATQLPTAAAGVSGDLYRTLTENDLCDVLAVIRDLNDWKDLGLQLGLLYLTLIDIETYRRGRLDDCRIDMLSAWLQQQDNVPQKGVPSWNVLRAALQIMGEHWTADKISN